ncbi:phage portal protein [Thomasclavelia ramosa]|uniref:phage portal protein n=1 Tax=Thomasclavelia ramosa TaxID=1547 RepID=UPI000E4CECB9|nr:phage portal protein [Thomasclavelia ramosa]RGT23162.1 phage portal protein [Thomasclavelia ramosa]
MLNAIRKGVSWLDAKLNNPLEETANNLKWLELELEAWLNSKERADQIKADMYYRDIQDIAKYKRMAIGEGGELEEVKNLPNHKVIDNQYKRLVNQKVNHLVGKPFTVNTNNKTYVDMLNKYFNKKFMKTLKSVGKDANNGGVSYLYPYYDNNELKFKRFKSYEIKVFWKDDEHNEIDFFWRYYRKPVRFSNGSVEDIQHLEVYTLEGVRYYIYKGGTLLYDKLKGATTYSYLTYTSSVGNEVVEEQHLSFERIPLIPFKVSDIEEPLLKRVKSLQDGINTITTVFTNNMLEDSRNTILIIMNYDGENLGEFRRNLSTYGAIKVRNTNEEKGGVDTLQIEVNAENYKTILEMFKKALIQNGGGVDVTELRASGTPNQMNIQSMYYDIELDTNDTETEFQYSMELLKWFIDFDINYQGKGNFFDEKVEFIFNRDMLQDETSIIDNLVKLKGIISDEDIIKQLPFGDSQKLIENVKKQKEEQRHEVLKEYANAFVNNPQNNPQINNEGDE